MIRWHIDIEVGEHDNRREDLINKIADLRLFLIGNEVKNTITEERDGLPPVQKWETP